jgi:hypothetical protein
VTTLALMRRIMSLEADKTAALVGLGRRSGAEAALTEADAALSAAMRHLATLGARYPLHMAAEADRLDATDYLIIQLALMPRVAPEHARAVAAELREDAPSRADVEPGAAGEDRTPADAARQLTLADAVAILGRGDDVRGAVEAAILAQRAITASYVTLGPAPDRPLLPGLAVRELLGWD